MFIVASFGAANAQTSSFIFQGKLTDSGAAANGAYQFEFKLFDAAANGNQIGQTISNLTATVTTGVFSVNLDFGTSSFNGSARYLEIAVRQNGGGQNYTPLSPRQAGVCAAGSSFHHGSQEESKKSGRSGNLHQ